MTQFTDRHLFEAAIRPEARDAVMKLADVVIRDNGIGFQLTQEVFTVSSLGAGCRHCQSHGAYTLSLLGVDAERIRDLWSFEESDRFSDRDRAALRFALAAGRAPSVVTPDHHAELRAHFTDAEITDILCVVCFAGWMNRWNDALATVTDQESVDWATENLTSVGWSAGRHVGDPAEQRQAHPITMLSQGKDPMDRD